jgi:hypothetical protein
MEPHSPYTPSPQHLKALIGTEQPEAGTFATNDLLALAGVAKPAGMRGRALLADRPLAPRDLVAELHEDPEIEEHIRPRRHRFALTRWPWKAIVDRDRTRRIYRADRDVAEVAPMVGAEDMPDGLSAAIEALAARLVEPNLDDTEPLDPEAVDGLRALGYIE